jgi:hypothetical protein
VIVTKKQVQLLKAFVLTVKQLLVVKVQIMIMILVNAPALINGNGVKKNW